MTSILFLTVLLFATAVPLRAQALESYVQAEPRPRLVEGMWTGHLQPPGFPVYDAEFQVDHVADSMWIAMYVNVWDAQFYLEEIVVLDDVISFQWWPHIRVECILRWHAGGYYLGTCKDEEHEDPEDLERLWPMVLAAPDVSVSADVVDLDEAAKDWVVLMRRAELDRIEGSRGTPVDVDGLDVNVHSSGSGDVTVVLEAGMGDDHRVWDYVQMDLEEFSRVVSYDRSGIGESEATSGPRTPARLAEHLRAALRASGHTPPYVLVGHGLGAAFVRAFALRHPDEVAGLVLVDPDHEAQGERWHALAPDSWTAAWEGQKTIFSMAPDPLRAEFDLYREMIETGGHPEVGALPDVPTVVITSMLPFEEPRWVAETPAGQSARRDLHRSWVEGLSQARHVVTDRSGRYVQREQPELVVEAIRWVLDAVRENPEARR